MRVDVINAYARSPIRREMVRKAVLRVLRKERWPGAKLSVVLAASGVVRSLNRTFLRHDYGTDVLSFCLEPGKNLEGEIYVNIDRARQQAREFRVGISDEIIRLAVHGTLHLLGYDDGTPKEERRMRKQEDEHVAYWTRKRRI